MNPGIPSISLAGASAVGESRSSAAIRTTTAQPEAAEAVAPGQRWHEWITSGNLGQIEQTDVPEAEAQAVAELCLRFAGGQHNEAVRRLLARTENHEVRSIAQSLLMPNQCDHEQQVHLVVCMLEAKQPLAWRSLDRQLRADALKIYRDRDWARKEAKYNALTDQSRLAGARVPPKLAAKGLPVFYSADKYSLENFNGRLGPRGVTVGVQETNLFCEALQKAADGTSMPTKDFLTLPLEEVARLDRYQLRSSAESERRAKFSIHFTSGETTDSFAELVTILSARLLPGERRTYPVDWSKKDGAHAMRLILENLPNGETYVGLYDPNVTRNIAHRKYLLPEEREDLRWDYFDRVTRGREGFRVETLAVWVDDQTLARECMGRLVTPQARVASLALAVGTGDHALAEWTLQELIRTGLPDPLPADAVEDLENALSSALQRGDVDMLDLFMGDLHQLNLSSNQVASIVRAANAKGATGLARALAGKKADAVATYMTGLKHLQAHGKLDATHVFDVLMGRGVPKGPALHLRYADIGEQQVESLHGFATPLLQDDAVFALISSLNGLGLSDEQIDQVIMSRDARQRPAVQSLIQYRDRAAVLSLFQGINQLRISGQRVAPVAESAVGAAMEVGNWNIVEDVLDETARMDPAQRAAVAAARRRDGSPGICTHIERGDARSVHTYLNFLVRAKIPLDQIALGLMHAGDNGLTALKRLMDMGRPEVLNALSTAIACIAKVCSPKLRKDLLAAIKRAQGEPGKMWGIQNSEGVTTVQKNSGGAGKDAYAAFKAAKRALLRN